MEQLNTPKSPGTNTQGANNITNGTRSRNRNRRGNNPTGSGSASERKFTGLDQDELKGIVIDGSKSGQYDKLFEGLKIVAGKKNSKVKTTLINSTKLTEDDFLPPMPDADQYTITAEDGSTTVNETKKRLLEELWVKKGERSTKRFETYNEDLKSMFSTIEGQLSPGVKQHLKTCEEWNTIETAQDTLALLNILREYCYRDSATKVHPMVDAINKIYKFFSCKQDGNKDAATYAEETKARFDVLTSAGITIRSKAMIKLALNKSFTGKTYEDYQKMDASDKSKVHLIMDEMLLSVVIVNGSNNKMHRNLAGVLKDNYSLGSDVYPTTQPKALELLNQYKSTRSKDNQGQGKNSKGHKQGDNQGETTDGTTLVSNAVETVPNEEPTNQDDEPTDSSDEASDTDTDRNVGPTIKEATQVLMAAFDDEDTEDELCFLQSHTQENTTRTNDNPAGKIRSADSHTDLYQFGETSEYMFSQGKSHSIDPYWLLLDSQATCNCVSNPRLLRNIRRHPKGNKIRIHCNAGMVVVDQIGHLPGFGTVWYQEGGMANILSLSLVSDTYRVTLDTAITQSFFVHKPDGSTRRFTRSDTGLYYCDLRETDGTMLAITSVEGQKKLYSDLDVRRATKARKLQEILGFPSRGEFLKLVDNNVLLNCPVTRRDVLAAEDIFGANTNIIKGKSVRQQPSHVREDTTPVPLEILDRYKNVTISIDIFTVNGIKFFRSVSRHLYFRTVSAIEDATQATLEKSIGAIIGVYAGRGFTVTCISGDNEFNCLTDHLLNRSPPVRFEGVARNQHEPYVERDNRTCKERIRCLFASVPFKRLPRRVTIDMVAAAIFWLNNWCNRVGVSATISPRQLMTGVRLDATKHCKFQFGDYVLGHEDASDNTMNPRARDAIYLRPTGDRSGAMYLFDLKTGRRIRRQTATGAHMTDTVISRVEQIAAEQNSPIGVVFGNRDGETTILDIDTESVGTDDGASDHSFEPDDDSTVATDLTGTIDHDELADIQDDSTNIEHQDPVPGDDDSAHGEGSMEELHEVSNPENEPNAQDLTAPSEDESSVGTASVEEGSGHTRTDHDSVEDNDTNACETTIEGAHDDHEDEDAGNSEPPVDPDDSSSNSSSSSNMDAATITGNNEDDNTVSTGMTLRPRVVRGHNKFGPDEGYESSVRHRMHVAHHSNVFTGGLGRAVRRLEVQHAHYVFISNAIASYNNIDASLVTKQYGVKAGLKLFGTAGVEAVLTELKQLHERKVVHPVSINELTRDEIKRALPYLMFLKRKRCGKIKARGCADGRTQRDFISREDTYSPTVSLHGLMLTCLIDAIEGRDVATADIPGAFLQTPMPEGEVVHIRFDGPMAELLARIDPEVYRKYMLDRKGHKVLYTQADKAIYGTLRAALLFWERLSGQLMKWGFELNPYDTCTANKIIKGEQCTIVWHVDDLKISHKDPGVVTAILDDLNKVFGIESPLTVTRGKVHDYVGMTIDYSEEGKVKFSMFDYLEGIMSDLPPDLCEQRIIPTPAADHLFKMNPDGVKLGRKNAETFHKHVAQLLFASKRARPDIQTAIAFLCTRVSSPDQDDWKKLRRVLGYVRDTIFLPLVLGWDTTGNAYWYVDASFAVHSDMKSHTGGVLTFGQGAVLAISTKQKLNTKSSTEAELVGVDDTLPYNLWCHYYLEWQGYAAKIDQSKPNKDTEKKYLGEQNILNQDNTSAMKLEMNGKSSSTKRTRHINIRYFLITDRVKKGEISIQYCPTGEMLADYFTKPLQGSLFRKFRNTIMGISDADYTAYQRDYAKRKANQ